VDVMKLHKITIQTEKPSGDFPGRVAEGNYTFEDNEVTLTNHIGSAIREREGKSYSQKLKPGEDPHVVAKILFREWRAQGKQRIRGFGERLEIQKTGFH
jgi:hypothetical protein